MPDYSRQENILSPSDIRYPVTIIGAGGIGSWLTLQLAKCGYPQLTVWDDDQVEAANCPNQAYRPDQIGRLKVEALAELVRIMTGRSIRTRPRKFTPEDDARGVVIVGVDSMAARTTIWRSARNNPAVPLYIDGRMAGESGRIYIINPMDERECDFYERSLYSDAEASPVPCGAKAIIHNLWLLNSLIAGQLKIFWKGGSLANEIIFDIPTSTFIYRSHHGQVLAITQSGG